MLGRTEKYAALIATCILTLLNQASYSADDSAKKLEQAGKLIDSGKAKPASVLLRQVIRSNPNSAEAHLQLGAALAALVEDDKYDEAISEEELAIKLDPKSSSARRILGMIYANQKKFDEAISMLNEACKLKPSSFAAHRDLATTYLAAGKLDDGIAAFKKAIELKPDNVAVHSKLAVVYSKKNDYANALLEANKAVELAPKKAETHLLLANIKLESGDSAGSVEPFKAAIAANGYDSLGCLNPLTAASAFSGLGWALASDKQATNATLDEAIRDQKKAIKAFPGFLTAYIRNAELLARQNKNKEAEGIYQNIFKASHQEASVGLSYSKFLSNTGRLEEARSVLQKVLEVSPQNKQASDALAALGQSKGK
ncbi:MAG: tetratricopeptide repeat protein [Candidatus Obscuribacterales bacterium]|nr:tetratricopeptide repeat protein [Candidatus Obscuribacterales bacterium]